MEESSDFTLDWNATRGAFYQIQETENLATIPFTNLGGPIWAGETLESFVLPAPTPGTPKKFFRVTRTH